MHRFALLLALVVSAAPMTGVSAEEQPLICFGTEPFWRLDLTEAGTGRFSTPDSAEVIYQGAYQGAFDAQEELVWRGEAVGPEAGDLIASLREGPCSDAMSDTLHPYSVNVSLPSGRHLAGCCRLHEVPEVAAGLENGTWRLIDLAGRSLLAGQGLPPYTLPRVRFEAGRLTGFSGCNQFMGSYALEGDRLIPGTLAGGMMSCAEPVMALESRFLGSFSGDLDVSLDGDRLTLTPVDGGDALSFEREAPPSLAGTKWEVTGYNNGRQAVVSPIVGTQLTLEFDADGVSGSAGCNRFHGGFEVDEKALTIGPLATTRKLCEEAVMTQEREFLAALEGAATWGIERAMLDLHRADGERALTAKAVDRQ
jgi:heat shock protein HslJ/uncharacterized membrane protein